MLLSGTVCFPPCGISTSGADFDASGCAVFRFLFTAGFLVTVLAPAVASVGLLSSALELVAPLAPFSLVDLLVGFSTALVGEAVFTDGTVPFAGTENIMLV
jgi:hypothetical protein